MRTIYGAELFKSPNNPVNFAYSIIGKNSEVFTQGDIATVDASDGLKVAGASDSVIGVVQKTQTMTSTNETVAKVTPPYIPVDQDYEFLMGTNSDMSPLTSVGAYFKITGTTGAQQVDTNAGAMTGSARIVLCTKVDPSAEGGTGAGSGLRQGLFKFVKVFNVKSNT
jgi:hypothetical protein